ncbi:MAG: hypothetical protein OXG35_30260 [Acidobacteria bacterium]|nr:hypothetical protein [Acidobacteriota bacterium]
MGVERSTPRGWVALGSFGRPFDTVGEMDEALFEAWRREVSEDDTVIVVGDVVLGSPRDASERLERVEAAPGRKILVYGNHDQNGVGGVVTDGFDEAYFALATPGDPPLLLTFRSGRFRRVR